MAEGMFDIQVDDLGNLLAAFQAMADSADDIAGPLMQAGREVQDRTIENYETEGGLTDFGFWIFLSEPYQEWKTNRYPGRQMLQLHNPSPLDDAVHDPFAVELVDDQSVHYVIRDEKAAWHQFGVEERQKGGTLPPRPIIPDSEDIEPHVERVFIDWVGDVIDEGYSRVRDMPWTPSHPWFRQRSSLGTFLPISPD